MVDDSYRFAGAAGVMALSSAASMMGDDTIDPESLSSADVLTSLAASRSPLTSRDSSSSSSSSSSGGGIGSSGVVLDGPFGGIASWATRKLPSMAPQEEAGEGGAAMALPQILEEGVDYSAIYNKNGRIGIYTREERRCIIARYHEKKRRRVWKKKIRYHCRKNLADRRVRVKGRFVRASSIDSNAPPDEEVVAEAAIDVVASAVAAAAGGRHIPTRWWRWPAPRG